MHTKLTRTGSVTYQSEYVNLEHLSELLNGRFFIYAVSNQRDGSALDHAHGKDAQQALGIDLAIVNFNPDAASELVGLLNKLSSLLVVQARFTSDNRLFRDHDDYSFAITQ